MTASVAAQRAPQAEAWGETPIRARMGIHTGAAEAHDGDYRGYLTLSHVQRIISAAHGGQILLSQATAALVSDFLPVGMTLRDLCEVQLKDFPRGAAFGHGG